MKTAKPKMIGSINCYCASPFKFGRNRGVFDGTIKGLCIAAQQFGARAGDIVEADFGLGVISRYRIDSAPHDDRCGGLWPTRIDSLRQG